MGADANAAYDLIKSYRNGRLVGPVSANLLILKESHSGGQQLNGQQKGVVAQWLTIEYGPEGGEENNTTLSQAFENFSNCMSFNDWDGRELDQLALQPVSSDGVEVVNANCETCHLDPDVAGGVLLNAADAQGTFDNFRIFPAIIKLVSASGFPFRQLVASDRLINKGSEYRNCVVDNALLDLVQQGLLNDEEYCHPNYIVAEAAEDQLQFFVENTIAIAANGNCANQGQ